MQAIIMAAGFGSRISKITNNLPKSYLEINNEKLIERVVRLLTERSIDDIVVVTGYKHSLFTELLPDHVTIVENPLYFCTNVLASFACGMNFLNDDFIFIHADTIFHESILDSLIQADDDDIVLPVDFKNCVEEEMKVTTKDGYITTINKGISLEIAEGEFIGVARVNSRSLDALKKAVTEELKENQNHNEYFEAAIQNLIDRGENVKAISTEEYPWIEIDFPEDYETACRLFS